MIYPVEMLHCNISLIAHQNNCYGFYFEDMKGCFLTRI
jgi:hypothetical protein